MTTHRKLLADQKRMISYLYQIPAWSPLEIAAELGLTFRQVCFYIDSHCLRKMDIAVARDVTKVTRADIYSVPPSTNPSPFAGAHASH